MAIRTPLLVGLGLALLTLSCVTLPTAEKLGDANATENESVALIKGQTITQPAIVEKEIARESTVVTVAQAIAQIDNIPQPSGVISDPPGDRTGDFSSRTGHLFWTVVDADPSGLNCRWSPDVPEAWYAPDADWSDRDYQNWPVAMTFDYGTVLTANITPAGFATVTDSRDLPWLKVRLGSADQICLVRASSRYILPIPYNTRN